MNRNILLALTALLALSSGQLFGQSRIIMNNNPYIVMDGGVFIVVDNGAANAITTTGTGGRIISEDEDNMIRWNIGTNTGTYVIPWNTSTTNNVKIPLTVNITGAGTGSGRIDFSTYETATDLNSPFPSDVTHMNDAATGVTNNSLFVVDRFWIIDAGNYTTKPTVAMTFAYDDNANELAGTNTLSEGNLVAQRFDNGNGTWGGITPGPGIVFGAVNTGANNVSGVNVADADFFRSWTLSDNTSPLPVELIYFNGICDPSGRVKLVWSTASETDNAGFYVERSLDLNHWEEVQFIEGGGNSSTVLDYETYDLNPFQGTAYYRIRQVDFSGTQEIFDPVAVTGCSVDVFDVSVYNNGEGQVGIGISSTVDETIVITVVDMGGRIIISGEQEIREGFNSFELDGDYALGYYMITLQSPRQTIAKKIFLN